MKEKIFIIKAFEKENMGKNGYVIYDIIKGIINKEIVTEICKDYCIELMEEVGTIEELQYEARKRKFPNLEEEEDYGDEYYDFLVRNIDDILSKDNCFNIYEIKEEFGNAKKEELLNLFMEDEEDFIKNYCKEGDV